MGKCEKWTIAYRVRKDGATILDDVQTAFTPIPNTWRYWRADPFLFENDGKNLFYYGLKRNTRTKPQVVSIKESIKNPVEAEQEQDLEFQHLNL